jgi:glycosyltransferase involved in cell wall biosynthesis
LLRFYIVGPDADQNLLSHKSENVKITGFVNDLCNYLGKANIFVAPLRVGAGVKNKVLQAMAMGKIVIGSPIAFEGIEGRNEKDFICLSTAKPKDWIDTIADIFEHTEKYEHIGKNARLLIEEKYTWESVHRKYFKLYKKITGL